MERYNTTKKKATGKLILNTFGWKLSVVITEKRLKCFFKGDRGGRVHDFVTQGVVKFRSLVKTENCLMLVRQRGKQLSLVVLNQMIAQQNPAGWITSFPVSKFPWQLGLSDNTSCDCHLKQLLSLLAMWNKLADKAVLTNIYLHINISYQYNIT